MMLFKSPCKTVAFDFYIYIIRQKSGGFSFDGEMRIYQSEVLLFYIRFVATSKVTKYSETIRKCLNVSFIGRSIVRNVDHLYLRTSVT
jgi:hypothetical protein